MEFADLSSSGLLPEEGASEQRQNDETEDKNSERPMSWVRRAPRPLIDGCVIGAEGVFSLDANADRKRSQSSFVIVFF